MNDLFKLEDLNLQDSTLEKVLAESVTPTEDLSGEPSHTDEDNKPNVINDNTTDPKADDSNQLNENEDSAEQPPSSDTPESTHNSSIFSVLANVLKEEGVVSVTEDQLKDIKDVKSLVDILKTSKIGGLTESQQRYLESMESGVPLNEFEVYETDIQNLKNITEERLDDDVQLRFEIIAHDFMDKGFSKEKAVELANRSVKLGTDKEDSRESLQILIENKQKAYTDLIEDRKKETSINLEKLKEKIQSKDSILNTIKLTDKEKNKVYDLMTIKVDVDPKSGKPINEFNKWYNEKGEDAELILNTLYLYTNKFKDLSKLNTQVKSAATLELEKRLRESDLGDVNLSLNSKSKNLKDLNYNF